MRSDSKRSGRFLPTLGFLCGAIITVFVKFGIVLIMTSFFALFGALVVVPAALASLEGGRCTSCDAVKNENGGMEPSAETDSTVQIAVGQSVSPQQPDAQPVSTWGARDVSPLVRDPHQD